VLKGRRWFSAFALIGVALTLGVARSATPPPSFDTATSLGTGANPSWVAIRDLNGDGRPDLTVVNIGADSASVLLRKADGTFRAKIDYPTGSAPPSGAMADLNGDGSPDLVTANYAGGTASSASGLDGKGDGTFEAKVDYPTGNGVNAIAIGDLNADGKPDLATANYDASTVSVLRGNGNGIFQDKVDYPTGGGPYAIAIGDLNGDGKPDVVTDSYGGSSLSVLLGKGDGSLETKVDYPTGAQPRFFAIGDVNGDGRLDLVTPNYVGSSVSVLLGKGDGNFQPKTDFPCGAGPYAVAIGDLNGDGKPDLATANASSFPYTLSVLAGKGDGSFEAKVDFPAGTSPRSVAIGDLNGDGRPDLASGDGNGSAVSVLANTTAYLPPGAVTGPASGIGQNAATITGSVSPHGVPSSYYFDFGPTTAYGLRTATKSAGAGTAARAVAETLTTLAPGTSFHYRLVATSGPGGAAFGADKTFTTTAPPPPPPPPPPVVKCVVPKVLGKTLPKAKAAIKKNHCRTGKVTRAYSKRFKRGRVIVQKPKAGKRLPAGSKVRLVVSKGRRRH